MSASVRRTRVALAGKDYSVLRKHLFPGDGKEAVAFVLCGKATNETEDLLLGTEVIAVPHAECSIRTPHRVTWPGAAADRVLQSALSRNLSILKIHSHPTGYSWFSETDDVADQSFFESASCWLGDAVGPMASLIMLPDGSLKGRSMLGGHIGPELTEIRVAGHDFKFWFPETRLGVEQHGYRVAQTFGEATYEQLRKLKVGVVGCSGTGSIVIEQLARNGVGSMVLVDHDHVELKNLNRILNSTMDDAQGQTNKTLVQARAIATMGLGTEVITFSCSVLDSRVVRALASCDVVFGCMDSVDGRHILNKISSSYLIPYIDVGVRLDADGAGGIESIWLAIHTVLPGGSSLKSRRVYDQQDLEAAFLLQDSPAEYRRLQREGYVKGVRVDRPAVISVNMIAASLAVNEFLARIHGFRLESNDRFAVSRMCLTDPIAGMTEGDGDACEEMGRLVGLGDQKPPLGMMRLLEAP